ncbi:hypothetical protein HELRODRAFT_171385 [Helobdella robusta]|uniref:Uncharacterized protein n=1 Tax=Helobdella robusta TaxID=6412 RepID=T1F478_HELRO|nr:hypothetical protein HELRODRAFT_171385 [Helobdella robusta]ESO05722.1 hypothetical protein HELRODRAFT_171385 [Helobdella robusta]
MKQTKIFQYFTTQKAEDNTSSHTDELEDMEVEFDSILQQNEPQLEDLSIKNEINDSSGAVLGGKKAESSYEANNPPTTDLLTSSANNLSSSSDIHLNSVTTSKNRSARKHRTKDRAKILKNVQDLQQKPFPIDREKLKIFQNVEKPNLPPMKETSEHTFLFKIPVSGNDVITPDPDHWMGDGNEQQRYNYVKMPYSSDNVMIVHGGGAHVDSKHESHNRYSHSEKVMRWQVIKSSLEKLRNIFIKSSRDIEDAIQTYHKQSHDYTTLHDYCDEAIYFLL